MRIDCTAFGLSAARITAVDGADGLKRLDAGKFDLVVSDIEMPVLDGWGFARAVRQRSRGMLAGTHRIARCAIPGSLQRRFFRAPECRVHEVQPPLVSVEPATGGGQVARIEREPRRQELELHRQ